MPKVQYSTLAKFTVIQEIENGQIGVKAATKKYGIPKTTLANTKG